jgi:Cu(I)/Ag(I) efflux system protein CusF
MNAIRPTLLFSVLLLAACSQPSNSAATAVTPTPTTDTAMPVADQTQAAKIGSAVGTVQSIDAAAGKITIAHGPVEALKWPAMTMTFAATPEQLATVKTGQKVQFEFEMMEGMDAMITKITPEN